MLTASEFVMTFLLNAIWQAALIVLATVVATRLLRRVSASVQYRLWVAAICLSLIVPLATSLWNLKLPVFGPLVPPTVSREITTGERLSLRTAESLPEDGLTASR